MKRWFNNRAVVANVVLATLFWVSPTRADTLDDLNSKIESWRLKEARRFADDLDQTERENPRAQFLIGKLLFFEGDFGGARSHLRRAIEGARAELGWKALRDLCAQTESVFKTLTKTEGESGQFVYRHKNGPDATLVPYAERALVRQRAALEKTLGGAPTYPIEIDILPDIENLAAASGLSVDQIIRTGTVGVTKYGRIMIVSPNVLATGYPWLDTLAHELTHMFITRVSHNQAPIWLHEGIAKLYERLWLNGELGMLTPEEAYLLDRAAEERRLIPLRRFHPSVAHLPNQEDAALAYAQVLSFCKYLNSKLGKVWAKKLLRALGEDMSLEQAFRSLSRFGVQKLYTWWRQEAGGIRQTPVPAVGLMKRRYKRGKTMEKGGMESILERDVRRHLRIGDLLRLRGHIQAAIQEFRQAEHLAESPSVEISNRLGSCLLETQKGTEALALLEPMAALYPTHSTVFVQLGRAYTLTGNTKSAMTAFERANGLNPFDPTVHCMLEDLYRASGQTESAKMEATHCRLLSSD